MSDTEIEISEKLNGASVRALAWLGALCIERYSRANGTDDPDVRALCSHAYALAQSDSLAGWERAFMQMRYHGMGDEFPTDQALATAIEWLSELTAGQMFGRVTSPYSAQCIARILSCTSCSPQVTLIESLMKHAPGEDGWGLPVSPDLYEEWKQVACGQS